MIWAKVSSQSWFADMKSFSIFGSVQLSSVTQSCPTRWHHGMQHNRLPCPSPIPRAYSSSCALGQWCHPNISSSVDPFPSCLQSFPAPGSVPKSQFFPSGGKSIGALASASVLPVNIQDWFPLGFSGWMSLQFKGLSRVFSNTTVQRYQFFSISQLSHLYMTTGKKHNFHYRDLWLESNSSTF